MRRRVRAYRRKKTAPLAWREFADQVFWGVCLSLVMAALVGGGWAGYRYIAEAGTLDLREVDVRGAERVGGELADYMRIRAGTTLTELDTERLRRRIEAHPWIRSAEVTRRWPDGLQIHIQEREPVLLHLTRRFYVVDKRGGWIKPYEARDGLDLPVVTGLSPRPVTEAAEALRRLARLVDFWDDPDGPVQVGEVHYLGPQEVWVYPVGEGPRLLLSLEESSWPESRVRLERVISETRRIGVELQSIDLLYPGKAIARRKT